MTWFISKPTSAEDSDTPQPSGLAWRLGLHPHRQHRCMKRELNLATGPYLADPGS